MPLPEYSFIPFQVSVALHNVCAIILTINYGVFVIGNYVYGKWHVLSEVEKKPLAQALETISFLCQSESLKVNPIPSP